MDKRTAKVTLTWFAVGLVAFAAIVLLTVVATIQLGAQYRALSTADLATDPVAMLNYNDHLLARLGLGIEIAAGDPAPQQTLASFQEASLRLIQGRVLGMGALYLAIISVLFARFGATLDPDKPGVGFRGVGALCMLAYLLFVAAFAVATRACGMPIVNFAPRYFVTASFAVSIGSMAVVFVLTKVRHKGIVTVIAIPVVVALFVAGFWCERSIFASPSPLTLVLQQESILASELGIDVFLFDPVMSGVGQFDGINRAVALAFEVLSPYSGISLPLASQTAGVAISNVAAIVYLLRGYILDSTIRFVTRRKEWKDALTGKHLAQ